MISVRLNKALLHSVKKCCQTSSLRTLSASKWAGPSDCNLFSYVVRNASSSSGSGGTYTPDTSQLFKPVIVKPNPDDVNLGEELAGKALSKQDLLQQLNKFHLDKLIKRQCKVHGLDDYLYHQAYSSFRKFCLEINHLPPEMYLLFCQLLQGSKHVHDILPHFLQHAR